MEVHSGSYGVEEANVVTPYPENHCVVGWLFRLCVNSSTLLIIIEGVTTMWAFWSGDIFDSVELGGILGFDDSGPR